MRMNPRRSSLCAVFVLFSLVIAAHAQAPFISKIDPPDWWVGFPSPMLLLHGSGLQNARFTLQAEGIRITRTQAAPNGHWAFLWLAAGQVQPQRITLTATNGAGSASAPFEFHSRNNDSAAHAGFSARDVIYLVMTDRFADGDPANNQPGYDRAAPHAWHGGDFTGLIEHLDYLHDLGVTALWTTPVASNAGMTDSYHGYAATDLYAVDPHFGTLDDYRALAAGLHTRGMKLILDLVPNHIGVHHPWVDDPPAPDWLHGTAAAHPAISYDFNQLVDPHAPPASSRSVTDGWFTDSMPDLNQENPLVEQYLIQNALWWVQTAGVDGLRLDTFSYVRRAFWHDFHATLHAAFPRLTTVGEVFNGDPRITSFFAGGEARIGPDGLVDTGLDTPFDFPLYFTLRDVLAHGRPMTALAETLRADALYPHPEQLVTFFGNHDTVRFVSEPGSSPAKLRLAFGLLATLRGTPEIYSGDEIALAGTADPDNRHDFPGGFAGDSANAFTAAGRTTDQQAMFAWVHDLLALRAQQPALTAGAQQNLFADNNSIVYVRGTRLDAGCSTGERIIVAATRAGNVPVAVHIATAGTALAGCTRFTPLLSTSAGTAAADSTAITLSLPPEGFVIYRAAP
jgi:neopullulanase